MSEFKDITVHVSTSESCEACLEVGIDLASRFDAHLTGLAIDPGLKLAFTSEVPYSAEVIKQVERIHQETVDKMRASFDKVIGHAGIAAEWRYTDRELVASLNLNARYCDLMIVGQEEPGRGEYVVGGLPDHVVMSAGVPVLIVPYIGVQRTIGKRVLVAWNGSREAIRAVHDAMPLLKRADSVIVLSVNPDEDLADPSHLPGADLATHLSRHSVNADVQTYPTARGSGMHVADALLSHVSDVDADLIVMGGYGHWRLRELMLGGVTRKLLETMTVPTLLSH